MLLYQEIINLLKESNPSKFKSNRVINKFKKQWITIMTLTGLYNKFGNTYSLNNIKLTDYGIKSDIYVVPSLTYAKLESKIEEIEEALNCRIILNHSKSSCWINVKFIFCARNNIKFTITKQESPYTLYIGNDYSGVPILCDLRKYPHLLISGSTRSGKSKMTDCILTNLVSNFTSKQVNLYLFQISKSDLVLYEDLDHTKIFANDLKLVECSLRYILEEVIPYREKLIKPYRKKAILDNMDEYNKLKKCINEQPMILLVFDETSSIYQTKGCSKEDVKLKDEIKGHINRIIQTSASLGIYTLISIQRPSVDSMPSLVKAQSNTIISFKQPNAKSSEVSTDSPTLSVGLEQREFVYKQNNWNYGYVPWIKNKEIYEFLKPNINPKHYTILNILKEKYLNNANFVSKNKKKIEFEHINKSKEEILKENIAKIKDFVPYNPILINKGRKKL